MRVQRFLRPTALLLLIALVAIGSLSVFPVLSVRAAGGEIAYVTNDGKTIHVVQADGSGDRQLLAAPSKVGSVAWAPGGTLLAYTTFSGTGRESQHIYLYDTNSGRTTELKSSMGTAGAIAFFPDGKYLAAKSGQNGTVFCDGPLVTIDLNTGVATPLATLGGCLNGVQITRDGTALIASILTGAPATWVVDVTLPSGTGVA